MRELSPRYPQPCADPARTADDIMKLRHLEPDCPRVDLTYFKDVAFILLRQGNSLYDRGGKMFREAGFDPIIKMGLSQNACHPERKRRIFPGRFKKTFKERSFVTSFLRMQNGKRFETARLLIAWRITPSAQYLSAIGRCGPGAHICGFQNRSGVRRPSVLLPSPRAGLHALRGPPRGRSYVSN